MSSAHSHYALGSADAEHERLIRQAVWLAPYTERCFREAGIGAGQRVLDVGSGVGDVALLLARLVGASGEVVGIERDPRSISRARTRIEEAGLNKVQFIESDVAQVRSDKLFDAAVGRYILMFLPDPHRSCARFPALFDPVEFWSSKRRLTVLFSPPPALCRFGRQALYFWRRSFGVAVQIRKWHPFFPAYSEMRVCQRHLCVLISC